MSLWEKFNCTSDRTSFTQISSRRFKQPTAPWSNNSFNRSTIVFVYPGNVYRFDVFIIAFYLELSIKYLSVFLIVAFFRHFRKISISCIIFTYCLPKALEAHPVYGEGSLACLARRRREKDPAAPRLLQCKALVPPSGRREQITANALQNFSLIFWYFLRHPAGCIL